ncbi:MAG: C40 family peptidase [Turneriella sp.]|nr:C40 family peptidase [Turneriella sp.]
MKFRHAGLLLLALVVTRGDSAQITEETIEQRLTECPPSVATRYRRSLPQYVKALPEKKADPLATLDAVLPRACYLELQDWQLQTALQLGHYGLYHGLKASTISDLTEVLSWRALSKDSYLRLGRTYERMLRAGAASEEIAEVLYQANTAGLSAEQAEVLCAHYATERSTGKGHGQALELALAQLPQLRKLRGDRHLQQYLSELPATASIRSRSGEKLSGDALWDYLENAIKEEPARPVIPANALKPAWDPEKLEAFFREWEGTPYRWGGFSRKGIDCSSFVVKAIESQFPNSKYPRSARRLAEFGHQVPSQELQAGDLVFFAAGETPGRITHVGIVIKGTAFAHASTRRGVTLSDIKEKYYSQRYVTARRLF